MKNSRIFIYKLSVFFFVCFFFFFLFFVVVFFFFFFLEVKFSIHLNRRFFVMLSKMCPVKILIRLREWTHMSEGTFSNVAVHTLNTCIKGYLPNRGNSINKTLFSI